MKKYLKEYTENLSVIILLFYVLGFCYQFFYYQFFDIDIQYYISLTDIIFISIGNLITSLIIFLFVEFVVFIPADFFTAFLFSYKNQEKYESRSHQTKYRFDRYQAFLISTNRKYYSFTLIIIFIFAGAFLFNDLLYFYTILIPNFIYHLYLIIEPSKGKLDVKLKKNITAVMLLIVFVLSYSYWGYSDASNVKGQYTAKVISFGDISTADNVYKYIGETSGYYFILNSKNDAVLIANKGGIDTATIQTNKYEEIERKQAEKQLNEFFEKVNYYLHINKKSNPKR